TLHLCFTIRRHLSSTLFPYTTLFRSWHAILRASGMVAGSAARAVRGSHCSDPPTEKTSGGVGRQGSSVRQLARRLRPWPCLSDRSEEHTSELQSRSDLVCRLLLEKKK